MTLPAVDERYLLRRIEGPSFKVGPKCSNPTCSRFAEHAHHIIPQPRMRWDWIAIDGLVTGNMTGLCVPCHDDIHADRAAIRWISELFWWCLYGGMEVSGEHNFHPVAPLRYQPPRPDTLATDPRASDNVSSPENCPYCGQSRKRRPVSAGSRVGRRKRKSWTVLVPDDELENGADVLDSLVDNLSPLVPNGDATRSGRYYVLVAALAHALIDGENFVASIEGSNKEAA